MAIFCFPCSECGRNVTTERGELWIIRKCPEHSPDGITTASELNHLRQENERLRTGINKATASLWSWIYSVKCRRINDIYDDLKNLVAK